jgi:hypothetical protein
VTVVVEGTSLRISVPGHLSLEPGSAEWRTRRWARFDSDGAGLAISVSSHQTLGPEQALDDVLRGVLKPPDGMYYSVKPMHMTLPSGRKVVFCEEVPNDGNDLRRFWRWLTIEDQYLVMVFEASILGAPPARKKRFEEIVDSLNSSR